jgi:NADPH-dependent ferric siderophore reductase
MSPHLVRVTFASEDFVVLGVGGPDQRVKLMFPGADGRLGDVGARDEQTIMQGSWYSRWRALPDGERTPIRTYTVRSARPELGEMDVDMVLHPASPHRPDGPAARWLRRARVGDEVVVVGPDARTADPTVGFDFRPGTSRQVLLAGDETAMPAICAIIEQLPAGVRGRAFIEVPTGADILDLCSAGSWRASWLARDAGCETAEGFQAVAPHGVLLTQAVSRWFDGNATRLASTLRARPDLVDDVDVDAELLWDSPPEPTTGDFYAWIAGEAATVKALRRHLVSDFGLDRAHVAFMGYWRRGRSEAP